MLGCVRNLGYGQCHLKKVVFLFNNFYLVSNILWWVHCTFICYVHKINFHYFFENLYFRWWHNPACFPFKFTVHKLLYRTLFMVVSNANEAKLYCIWIYNIERLIFSDGVLLPFGKQRFFSVFVLTPTLPQHIFPLFLFLFWFWLRNTWWQAIPKLLISIHVH